jgi:hypothetical protein
MYVLGWTAYSGRRYATWYGLIPVSTTAITTCDRLPSFFVHCRTRSPSKPKPAWMPGVGRAAGASPFCLSAVLLGSHPRNVNGAFAPSKSVITAKREPSGIVPVSPPTPRVITVAVETVGVKLA